MTDHTDPDDPTSMALPVIGDTVLLTDGTTSKIRSRVGNTWKVQDDLTDHEHIVTIDQIAGYPEDVAWVRGQFEPAPAPQEVCPRCAGTNGRHGMVHQRYGNGWGRNKPCPNTPVEPDVAAAPDPVPVSYLVAERRAGKWLIGDDWSSEHDTLDAAREYLQRFGGPPRGYDMGILAVTLVEELR